MCIITLTVVFGISLGKVRAEYTQAVRSAGTRASACIERAERKQYEKVRTLGYVKHVGRSMLTGEGLLADSERRVCMLQWLDRRGKRLLSRPIQTSPGIIP